MLPSGDTVKRIICIALAVVFAVVLLGAFCGAFLGVKASAAEITVNELGGSTWVLNETLDPVGLPPATSAIRFQAKCYGFVSKDDNDISPIIGTYYLYTADNYNGVYLSRVNPEYAWDVSPFNGRDLNIYYWSDEIDGYATPNGYFIRVNDTAGTGDFFLTSNADGVKLRTIQFGRITASESADLVPWLLRNATYVSGGDVVVPAPEPTPEPTPEPESSFVPKLSYPAGWRLVSYPSNLANPNENSVVTFRYPLATGVKHYGLAERDKLQFDGGMGSPPFWRNLPAGGVSIVLDYTASYVPAGSSASFPMTFDNQRVAAEMYKSDLLDTTWTNATTLWTVDKAGTTIDYGASSLYTVLGSTEINGLNATWEWERSISEAYTLEYTVWCYCTFAFNDTMASILADWPQSDFAGADVIIIPDVPKFDGVAGDDVMGSIDSAAMSGFVALLTCIYGFWPITFVFGLLSFLIVTIIVFRK